MKDSKNKDNHPSKDTALAEFSSNQEGIIQQRKELLNKLRAEGWSYPNNLENFTPLKSTKLLIAEYGELSKEDLEKIDEIFHLAGRIVLKRDMGKAAFLTLQDRGERIQVYLRQDSLLDSNQGDTNNSSQGYNLVKNLDLGDIIAIKGKVFRTNKGEFSLKAQDLTLLTKSIRPLPDKYHGLLDTEQRYRKRYLDVLLNKESAEVFVLRSKILQAIREFFSGRGYLEVETPMLHTIAGGAIAKPFTTFHNSLDMKMYLRIAPELFLKRLLVGGFDRVFEINRNFRNEGLSTNHNPEFTMLEFYQAYANYEDYIKLIEELLAQLINVSNTNNEQNQQTKDTSAGKDFIEFRGHRIDIKSIKDRAIKRISHKDAVLEFNKDLSAKDYESLAAIKQYSASLGIKPDQIAKQMHGNKPSGLDEQDLLGKLQNEIMEKTVEDKLIQPTFITHYPAAVSPLARRNDDDSSICDRFELFIGGAEIANGFSELNDPEEQARVLKMQAAAKSGGDDEAMNYDEDYVTALEYAMPPAAGAGIGIDRLVMLLSSSAGKSSSIRDVIFFPTLKNSPKPTK